MHAPNLTVQGGSYLLEQLRHFAHGIRGGPTDFYGWQMNGRAKALPDDSALRDVVAFIETLPRARASPMVTGNVAHGRELYSVCASCHGARGEGSAGVAGGAPAVASGGAPAVSGGGSTVSGGGSSVSGGGSSAPVGPVPALAGLDDYYQLAQLEAFTSGARGTKKDDDPQGAIMRAAAAGISSKEAARDVVAYIATLQARAVSPAVVAVDDVPRPVSPCRTAVPASRAPASGTEPQRHASRSKAQRCPCIRSNRLR
jgi:cytochrome c553